MLYNEHLNGAKIKTEHIKQLRVLEEIETIDEEDVESIVNAGNHVKGREISISEQRLNYYFSADYSSKDIKEIIYRLLDEWKNSQEGEN